MKRRTFRSYLRRPRRVGALPLTGAALVGLLLPLVGAGAASATPGRWETFHDEGSGTVDNFCGVSGLTMENSWVVNWRSRTTARGPDRLPYYEDFTRSTDKWINVASGEFVTVVAASRTADSRVTDNGDGTLTETLHSVGIVKFYGGNGRLINVIAGHLYGYVALIDHGGTPRDPSDDEFLSIVQDLGGKLELFCPTVLEAIG